MRLLRRLEGRAGCWWHLEGTEGQKASRLPAATRATQLCPAFSPSCFPSRASFSPGLVPRLAGMLSVVGMVWARNGEGGLCRRGTGVCIWEVPGGASWSLGLSSVVSASGGLHEVADVCELWSAPARCSGGPAYPGVVARTVG